MTFGTGTEAVCLMNKQVFLVTAIVLLFALNSSVLLTSAYNGSSVSASDSSSTGPTLHDQLNAVAGNYSNTSMIAQLVRSAEASPLLPSGYILDGGAMNLHQKISVLC